MAHHNSRQASFRPPSIERFYIHVNSKKILVYSFNLSLAVLQDAEELYSEATLALSQCLKQAHGLPDLGGASNLVDALFGLQMETTDTCQESPDEAPVVATETARKLVCNISGPGAASGAAAAAATVDHLHEGRARNVLRAI